MTYNMVTRRKKFQAQFDALGGWQGMAEMLEKVIEKVEQDAATIARLEGENADLTHDLDRIKASETAYLNASLAAEAQVAALVEALEAMRGKAIILRGEQAYREFSRYVEKSARAAIAAAKEKK